MKQDACVITGHYQIIRSTQCFDALIHMQELRDCIVAQVKYLSPESTHLLLYAGRCKDLKSETFHETWQLLWTDDGRLAMMRNADYLNAATSEVTSNSDKELIHNISNHISLMS